MVPTGALVPAGGSETVDRSCRRSDELIRHRVVEASLPQHGDGFGSDPSLVIEGDGVGTTAVATVVVVVGGSVVVVGGAVVVVGETVVVVVLAVVVVRTLALASPWVAFGAVVRPRTKAPTTAATATAATATIRPVRLALLDPRPSPVVLSTGVIVPPLLPRRQGEPRPW